MENRELIVAEYFRLRVLLNSTNLKTNESTEIVFQIRTADNGTASFYAAISAFRGVKNLELCQKYPNGLWTASNYSGLYHLEKFCADFLRRNLEKSDREPQAQEALSKLNSQLRSLGLSR